MMITRLILIISICFLPLFIHAQDKASDFSITDHEGKYLDVTYQGRALARYSYEPIDTSSAAKREATLKPYWHVFRPGSDAKLLTKGAGGKFPHHRGIFYGFSKISYSDDTGKIFQNVDTWHCKKAHQVHLEMAETKTDAQSATVTSLIDWVGDNQETFAQEERSLTFRMLGQDLVIDFHSRLHSLVSAIRLDGDPQHAGFQFRAHEDVADKTSAQTYYIRPQSGIGRPGQAINWSEKNDTPETRDLPWKAMSVLLDDVRYTVSYLDHPNNPKPARHSERDYGRFGSYFSTDVAAGKALEVRYRLVISQGEKQPSDIERYHAAFLQEHQH